MATSAGSGSHLNFASLQLSGKEVTSSMFTSHLEFFFSEMPACFLPRVRGPHCLSATNLPSDSQDGAPLTSPF